MTIEHRGKWFQDISPQQPASEVARWTLAKRLDIVRHYLPLAALKPEEDTEHVHQLRVGCRRARAAISAWMEFLPGRQARRVKRMLRKIRESANDARDADVLLERLQNDAEGTLEGIGMLVEQMQTYRQESQAPILKIYQKFGHDKLAHRMAALTQSVAWHSEGSEPTFSEFARCQMAVIADEFFDVATDNSDSAKGLHVLRIAAKRLRYSMEIFSEAFCDAFRETIYPVVEQLQDTLGALNDHHIAQGRYQRIVATLPPNAVAAYLATLIQEEWSAFDRGRDEFLAWWTTDRVHDLQTGLTQAIHMRPDETGFFHEDS